MKPTTPPPSNTQKKPWTAPVIESIQLSRAKNGSLVHGDGPVTGKS